VFVRSSDRLNIGHQASPLPVGLDASEFSRAWCFGRLCFAQRFKRPPRLCSRNFRRELIQSQLPQMRHAAEALQELLRRARYHAAYLRYYIGLDTKSATYNRGAAHDLRHTIGIRMFRPIGKGFDYNWEPNYQ
jgi:hypothetical protein